MGLSRGQVPKLDAITFPGEEEPVGNGGRGIQEAGETPGTGNWFSRTFVD